MERAGRVLSMQDTLARILVCAAVALAIAGCLAATGGGAGAWLLSDGGDDDGGGSAPAIDLPDVAFRGPWIPLESNPVDVAIGEFVPDEDGERRLDVAVVFESPSQVVIFRGDGTGELHELKPSIRLSSSPKSLSVLELEGPLDLLVVATATTLEAVRFPDFISSGKSDILARPYEENGQRDITVGDFDGDGIPDIAVSSARALAIQVFLGAVDSGGVYRLNSSRNPAISDLNPRAIVAANFDNDGLSDLAVLSQDQGEPTISLYLSNEAGFRKVDRLVEGDLVVEAGASLVARDDSFFNQDPFPDLVALRKRNAVRILVSPDDKTREPVLSLHSRPSGATSRAPRDVALLRLPRATARPELWDMVVLDDLEKSAIFSYAESENAFQGIEKEKDSVFPLPGTGRAVAVGDVDGDLIEDVAIVTSDPSTLCLLLANQPRKGVEDAPFRFPRGAAVGETPPLVQNFESVAVGRTGTGRSFVVTSDSLEIFVYWIDELDGQSGAPNPQRYSLADESGKPLVLNHLGVGDLDLDGGDDVILGTKSGSLFWLRSSDSTFEWYAAPATEVSAIVELQKHFDLLPEPLRHCRCQTMGEECEGGLEEKEPCVELRRFTIADLDGSGYPDLAAPVSRDVKGRDYLVVVFDPGRDPGAVPHMEFVRVFDGPRHVAVANVNADQALDLIVANEDSPESGVLIVFGDPDNPGRFFEVLEGDAQAPPGYVEPMGFNGGGDEMEAIATDNDALGFDEPIRFIIASSDTQVHAFFNVSSDPHRPKFEGPCLVYTGVDPETVLVVDLFPEDSGQEPHLDLIIGDEDKPSIVVLENVAEPSTCSPWEELDPLVIDGRPDGLAVHSLPDGRRILFAAPKEPSLEWYEEEDCGQGCVFAGPRKIDLTRRNEAGGPLGLSVGKQRSGGWLTAAIVEDGEPITGVPAIDVALFSKDASKEDLRQFGDKLCDKVRMQRLRPFAPNEEIRLDAVLVGNFAGDAKSPLDLLVHDSRSSAWFSFAGASEDEPVFPEYQEAWSSGSLVTWSRLELPSGEDLVFAATNGEVFVFDPRERRLKWSWSSPRAPIVGAACAWVGQRRKDLTNLRVAVLLFPGRVELPISDYTVPGRFLAVSAGDFDGDGTDDFALVSTNDIEFLFGRGRQHTKVDAFAPLSTTSLPVQAAALDSNGDDRVDLCLTGEDGRVFLLHGDGLGGFPENERREFFPGPGVEAVRTADLDRNGKDEILVANQVPGLAVFVPEEE